MFWSLIRTERDYAALILRLMLAVVMFPHGAQKVLGWFGGPGFQGAMHGFTQGLHIPAFLAFLAIFAEFAGALALLCGFMGRLAALAIGIEMIVAVWLVHWPYGFFMNWFGTQKGEGFEYHLLAIGIAIALVIKGSGAFSLDLRLNPPKRR